LCTATAAHFML